TIAKDTGHATVLCALCNLKDDFPAHPAAQAIDVYSYFTDRFYGVKDARPIIPHEREFSSVPADETPSEEVLATPESPKSEVQETLQFQPVTPATAGTDQLTFRSCVAWFPFLVDWYQEIDYSVDSCSPVPERLDQILLIDLEDVRQSHSGMQWSVPLRGPSCF